jgi:hypothetical protein
MEKQKNINHIRDLEKTIVDNNKLIEKAKTRKDEVESAISQCLDSYFKTSKTRTRDCYFELTYTECDDKFHAIPMHVFHEDHRALMNTYESVRIIANFRISKNVYKTSETLAVEKMYKDVITYMEKDVKGTKRTIEYLKELYHLEDEDFDMENA